MSRQPSPTKLAPPLAGKPPFDTDDDDSIFEQTPRTARPPKGVVSGDQQLATHDQYLNGNRDSGAAFGVGMGLMGEVSDSDESDDERAPAATAASTIPNGKNRALYEAATRQNQTTAPLVPATRSNSNGSRTHDYPADKKDRSLSPSPPQYTPHPNANGNGAQRGPGRVGTGNGNGMTINIPPPRSPMPAPVPQRPVPAFMMRGPPSPLNSPMMAGYPSTSPHPLPPSTPITPLFAAPPASFQAGGANKVTFSPNDGPAPIMRGQSEDSLMARPRPQKEGAKRGDDFWKRFSMVAHQQEEKRGEKTSSWLQKTQNGGTSLSRWVWVTGICFLLAIGAGVGLGWYFTHNNPAHQDPVAIGGSENHGLETTSALAKVSRTIKVASAASTPTAAAAVVRRFHDIDSFEQYVPSEAPEPVAVSVPKAHRRGRAKHMLD